MEWITSLIAALLGGGIFAAVSQLIKARSDSQDAQITRLMQLVDQLQEDNTRIRTEFRSVETAYAKKCEEMRIAIDQLEKHYQAKCAEYEALIILLKNEIAKLERAMHEFGVDIPEK